MAIILCVDTDPATTETLNKAGHDTHVGSVGYTNGTPRLLFPPHESDLIVCDLKRPACYDNNTWGPGGNDNYHCKIVENPSDEYVIRRRGFSDEETLPRYRIIHEGQMARVLAHTFKPVEIWAAIERAGVPAVIFLNRDWIRHVAYDAPNILGITWRFSHTTATKLTVAEPLERLISTELLRRIKIPIKFSITQGPATSRATSTPTQVSAQPIVSNAIGEVFGQLVKAGNGHVWALPEFDNNAEIILAIFNNLSAMGRRNDNDLTMKRDGEGKGKSKSERDVFISHASEDKLDIARPLAEALTNKGVSVWFDEYELLLGDRLREKIDAGLRQSRFGVTILSHHFFAKDWPQSELDGLLALERGTKKILPVWHGLNSEDIRAYSPTLAGRVGVQTSRGLDAVVAEIVRVVRKNAN